MFKKALFILSLCPSFGLAQSYVVYDFTHNRVLESHASDSIQPIASVTKLMTANVFLENNKNPNCRIAITKEDTDRIKGTGTKLPKNIPISCNELLKAMLVHSDNYAAHALSRAAGISRRQFIKKMNEKAHQLGMYSTRFHDSSGLSSYNISSPMDLVKLAKYSLNKSDIKRLSNLSATYIQAGKHKLYIKNTNKLVRDEIFDAAVNKTGYIQESGYNLVFINKHRCKNATIGVISLNNISSEYRSSFTKSKLEKFGCTALNGRTIRDVAGEAQYEDGYDEVGFNTLIQKLSK